MSSVDEDEVASLISTQDDRREIDSLCMKLREINSIIKELHSNSVNFNDARIMFNEVMD